MHDQPKEPETNAERDLRRQGSVLTYVVETYPGGVRLSELVRELTGGSEELSERLSFEDAVHELRGAGLVFRCEAMVLPTRAAIRAYEVLVEAA
jgi:hypothetical protein